MTQTAFDVVKSLLACHILAKCLTSRNLSTTYKLQHVHNHNNKIKYYVASLLCLYIFTQEYKKCE